MRVEKQREFGRLKFEYEQLRKRWGGYAGYDHWFSRPLNNADLAAIATYRDCMPGLQKELDAAVRCRSSTSAWTRSRGCRPSDATRRCADGRCRLGHA
jgi:predicted aminopeptidase